jgi:putative lipoic acid-binding regulatory protein
VADKKAPEQPGGERTTLLEFPCAFPLKIMGRANAALEPMVLAIVLRHAPDFVAATMETRASTGGKYLSLTCTINATSQAQLDAIYRELTSHPLVKVVL